MKVKNPYNIHSKVGKENKLRNQKINLDKFLKILV